jgi:hypothetical protein
VRQRRRPDAGDREPAEGQVHHPGSEDLHGGGAASAPLSPSKPAAWHLIADGTVSRADDVLLEEAPAVVLTAGGAPHPRTGVVDDLGTEGEQAEVVKCVDVDQDCAAAVRIVRLDTLGDDVGPVAGGGSGPVRRSWARLEEAPVRAAKHRVCGSRSASVEARPVSQGNTRSARDGDRTRQHRLAQKGAQGGETAHPNGEGTDGIGETASGITARQGRARMHRGSCTA